MIKASLALSVVLLLPTVTLSQTLCEEDESIQFSCPVGKKVVSLCGKPKDAELSALIYRYGTRAKVEIEWSATLSNGQSFSFDVAPAGPQTSVSMIWWDKGPFRYLMSECSGGNCPFAAGLAVFREDKLLMNQRCVVPEGQVRHRFTGDLVEFGFKARTSKSLTPLVRNGFEYGSDITQVYRVKE